MGRNVSKADQYYPKLELKLFNFNFDQFVEVINVFFKKKKKKGNKSANEDPNRSPNQSPFKKSSRLTGVLLMVPRCALLPGRFHFSSDLSQLKTFLPLFLIISSGIWFNLKGKPVNRVVFTLICLQLTHQNTAFYTL